MLLNYSRSITKGLTTLLFEVSCLICGSGNLALCEMCQEPWSNKPRKITGESFPVFTKAIYDDAAAKIVLLAKESGLKSAQEILASSLADATLALLSNQEISDGRINLVPIPSSRRAQSRRGEDFLYQLTKLTKVKLSKAAPLFDFQVCKLLKPIKSIKDQSGLRESERNLNLSGAFSAGSKLPEANQVVILDDVVTTGSTLREAYRALKERNLTVLGAATACASQRRLLIR